MNLPFVKMHALGNDFMLLIEPECALTSKRIRAWSDRHCGVGFDQLLLLRERGGGVCALQIYNSDGSPAEACGNGARCAAFLWMERSGANEVLLQVGERRLQAWRAVGSNRVSVDMGPVALALEDAALCAGAEACVRAQLGNPHLVVVMPLDGDYDLNQKGAFLQKNPVFRGGVNVDFVQKIGKNHIRVCTYERGAGRTLACGSGACAAAAAAAWLGLVCDPDVCVDQALGSVLVTLGSDAILTGEVSFVFQGELRYSSL